MEERFDKMERNHGLISEHKERLIGFIRSESAFAVRKALRRERLDFEHKITTMMVHVANTPSSKRQDAFYVLSDLKDHLPN